MEKIEMVMQSADNSTKTAPSLRRSAARIEEFFFCSQASLVRSKFLDAVTSSEGNSWRSVMLKTQIAVR
jgi:hypothetical protein